MSNPVPSNILEYLEMEDENAKFSAKLHVTALAEFPVVNETIQACLKNLRIDNTPANMVSQLYQFVHYQFIAATTN